MRKKLNKEQSIVYHSLIYNKESGALKKVQYFL